jgi:tetratricopeptide (TPR) repeat protein
MRDDRPFKAADAFRDAAPPERRPAEEWVRTDVRDEAKDAVTRGASRRRTPRPPEVTRADEPGRPPKVSLRLADATKAYERERYVEAQKILKPLAERAPGDAAVRELHGLTLYRLGRWKQAVGELEAFRSLTGSTEQHPVLADCYRALKRYRPMGELWDELRTASPSAELVAEGRIVMAGALGDRGQFGKAIELLDAALKSAKRLKPHHVRMLYVLADLVERAGDIPRARQLFRRVAQTDPEFADVQARLRSLR